MSDEPRADALRGALVDRLSDRDDRSPTDEELFAFAEGAIDGEEQQRLRRRLVHHAEDRRRFEEIREFAVAEAQLAPAADSQADVAAFEESSGVEVGWSDFLDRLAEPGGEADTATTGDNEPGPDLDGVAGLPPSGLSPSGSPPRPWFRFVAPALAAMGVVVAVLTLGPGQQDPGVGWDLDQAASRGTVVFEQRSGPVQRIVVNEGEQLRLEVFHPALPTDCSEIELRVRRHDGGLLPVSRPERAGRWLRIDVSQVESGRHTLELTGCGVEAAADVEIVPPEGR